MSYAISIQVGNGSLYALDSSTTDPTGERAPVPMVYETYEDAKFALEKVWKGYGKVVQFNYLEYIGDILDNLKEQGLTDTDYYKELSEKYQDYALSEVMDNFYAEENPEFMEDEDEDKKLKFGGRFL